MASHVIGNSGSLMQRRCGGGTASSSRPARTPLRCSASKTLTGPCIVKMSGQCSNSCKVEQRHEPGSTLQEYMTHAATNFANIELPMGGKISSADSDHIELVIPRIQLFDVWLQPRALAKLSVFPERISFTSKTENCILDGSSHVKDFRLDERFVIDVTMTFRWKNPAVGVPGHGATALAQSTILADGSIVVEVDIPPPFSFVPMPILNATANTALTASLSLIINSFVNRLAEDYAVWASNPELRKRRLQIQIDSAKSMVEL